MKKLRNINRKILSMLFAIGFTFLPISDALGDGEKSAVISIFAEENNETKQYGANQKVFKKYFTELINDPYVWKEMQKYYPEKNFSCHEEALAFYKSYFGIIYDCGCGYAVACDVIFKYFEDKPKEFEKTFGYPMYTIRDGVIDYNYEVLLLEFFNFSVLQMQNEYETIERATRKDMYDYELNAYITSKDFLRKEPENMTEKQKEEWNEFKRKRSEKYMELYNRWSNEPEPKINLGIELNASFGYLYVFLSAHHLDNSIMMVYTVKGYEVGDIVAAGGFHLYESEEQQENEDSFHSDLTKVGDHYVYVTEITPDGKIIVSSWGERYIFDPTKATWKNKVLIKIGNDVGSN